MQTVVYGDAALAMETVSYAEELANLQVTAIQAYRAKDLITAMAAFDKIISLDSDNPVWYERRGQVRPTKLSSLSKFSSDGRDDIILSASSYMARAQRKDWVAQNPKTLTTVYGGM